MDRLCPAPFARWRPAHELLTRYGTPEQHDKALGLTPTGIRARLERFLAEYE